MRIWQQSMIFLARNEPVKKYMQNHAGLTELATRFVGGSNTDEAAKKAQNLKSKGIKSSLFYLGEYVEDLSLINRTVTELKTIAKKLADQNLDAHISADPTQIGYQINEIICHENAVQIAGAIKTVVKESNRRKKNFLMLDMEDSSVTESTIRLYEKLNVASLPAALTLQSYLYRTENDLKKIVQNGGVVRLVKGAFAEGKDIAFTNRSEIDGNFMKLAKRMLSDEAKRSGFYPVFGTHDENLIKKIIALAEKNEWEKQAYEIEMLFGVRNDLQKRLVGNGEQIRVYLPFGTDWWSYAVRRVGESPKSAKFLLRSLLAI